MTTWRSLTAILLLVVVGCASPATPSRPLAGGSSDNSPPASNRPAGPKRVVVAIAGNPNTLSNTISRAGSGGVAGVDALEDLVHAGMSQTDDGGLYRAQLAEAVPSIENGQWRLLPDGRMETTWRIRPNAQWHDGSPVTADDLAFTIRLGQDRELPALGNAGYAAIEGVDAPDQRTITVRWKQAFVQADTLFTSAFGMPLPKHLLERPYLEDKTSLLLHPYWTTEFVGAGPFRVRSWAQDSHLILVANDAFVLGRPKLDEVEVKFIPDPSTMMANVLAGEVELTMGRSLSLEQAVQLRDQWREGKLGVVLSSWIAAYPQMLTPTPAVIADVRFRRALLHAVDRQQLVDSLQAGQSMVAHSYVSPREPEYKEIEASIVKYDYDVRRAAELVEGLGFTRGPDGGWRDAGGQRLAMEVRTTGGDDLQEKTMFAMSDAWQRLGIAVDPVVVPRQRAQDREYRANFPALEEVRQPNDLTPSALTRYHGMESSVPDNNYRGSNRMRYRSAELDAFIDRYYVTVPKAERTQALGQITRHMTDQVIPLGMFYNSQPTMIANRLQNVGPGGSGVTPAWNSYAWDVRS